MHTTFNQSVRSRRICWVAIPMVLLWATAAQASTVQYLAGNIGATPIFDGGTDLWTMPEARLTNGTLGDGGGFGSFWTIDNSATISWEESALLTDLNPLDPTNPADALFDSGGVLTIRGIVYDASNNMLFDGLLLEGEVSPFQMTETGAVSNNINLEDGTAFVTVTGGFLSNNTEGMTMPVGTQYWLDTSFAIVEQDGGELENWQGDSYSATTSTGITLVIPEPTTGLFLLCGSMILIRRRPR
jgi:hypothetical protein